MDLDSLYRDVSKLQKDGVNGKVGLYFITKKGDHRFIYHSEIEEDVQTEFVDMFLHYFRSEKIRKNEQRDYELVTVDGVFYNITFNGDDDLAKDQDYYSVKRMCTSILEHTNENTGDSDAIIESMKNIKLHQIKGYVVKIKCEGYSFLYIGGLSEVKRLKKNALLANLTNTKLKKISGNDIIGFNSDVGIVFSGNEVLFTKVGLFESIFDLTKEITVKTESILSEIETLEKESSANGNIAVENLYILKDYTKHDKRVAKRLAKIDKEKDILKAFFSNIDGIREVLESDDFKSEFEGIHYNKGTNTLVIDEGAVHKFVTLLSDAPYESIIAKKKRIDGAR
ncbi:DUF4868 domain-containing protein [Listeria booriae]|uniref:DUF4868 domain-containing protein n=1 Tax=Listeria booriae TaxID=1552123 RepID=A0A7X1CL46_9LIST|nr:Kiwa anti-phage protein KwaB-like domain-containing protein [Listeria booriae]MBC1792866.1 DUF4868 domain-containing protein [Listeria booriae]MBC1797435.1 DUF4868 domain-containing protein [Listeria booriae]MBC1812017.1 DUF4868 domain-containing protein [Listeria booriae]